MNSKVMLKLVEGLHAEHGRMSVFMVTPDNQWHAVAEVDHTVMRDSGEENHVLLLRAGVKKDLPEPNATTLVGATISTADGKVRIDAEGYHMYTDDPVPGWFHLPSDGSPARWEPRKSSD